MDIVFETTGSTAAFKQWLQAFGEIDDSLLVEIDLVEDIFVAKSYTNDKTIVKYGKISFAQCGLEVKDIHDGTRSMSISEWTQDHTKRVYLGFLHNLSNVIKQLDIFSSDDSSYKIIVRFVEEPVTVPEMQVVDGKRVTTEKVYDLYVAKELEFKSLTLSMLAPVYNMSEFELKLLDDGKFFNGLANIPEAVSFNVTTAAVKKLFAISEVHSADVKKDAIKFVISNDESGWHLRAFDQSNARYDFCLSDQITENSVDPVESISTVTRTNYIIANKGDKSEDNLITISTLKEFPQARMKIESGDGQFTTILANVVS